MEQFSVRGASLLSALTKPSISYFLKDAYRDKHCLLLNINIPKVANKPCAIHHGIDTWMGKTNTNRSQDKHLIGTQTMLRRQNMVLFIYSFSDVPPILSWVMWNRILIFSGVVPLLVSYVPIEDIFERQMSVGFTVIKCYSTHTLKCNKAMFHFLCESNDRRNDVRLGITSQCVLFIYSL